MCVYIYIYREREREMCSAIVSAEHRESLLKPANHTERWDGYTITGTAIL